MPNKLKRLFLLWFILEIIILCLVADALGFLWALILFFAPMFLGAYLIKSAGMLSMRDLKSQMFSHMANPQSFFKKIGAFLSGILFGIPGILSSIIALFLLIPFMRNKIISYIMNRALNKSKSNNNNPHQTIDIDQTEWREVK